MIRINTLFQYVCYHPTETQIIATGTDRKISYFETFDASLIRDLEGSMSGGINSMDIPPNGDFFVTGGNDKLVKVTFPLIMTKLLVIVVYSNLTCSGWNL